MSTRLHGPSRARGIARSAWLLIACLCAAGAIARAQAAPAVQAQTLIDRYLVAWAGFYPTQAFARGDAGAALRFEDYAPARVSQWLRFNRETRDAAAQALLETALPPERRVDLRVLARQADDELASWQEDRPLQRQPAWYAGQVSQALTHLLVRDQLDEAERIAALRVRLAGVRALAETGVRELAAGGLERTQRAAGTLASASRFYREGLIESIGDWLPADQAHAVAGEIAMTAEAVDALREHIETHILPQAVSEPSIGADIYAAKLARDSAGEETPESLGRAALAEVREVRRLMVVEARRWARAEKGLPPTADDAVVLERALQAMEADRRDASAPFLKDFVDITAEAEAFVRDQGIATVPQPTTLYIALSPSHFAGAAVGGVYPPGPFAPEADTLFYVPSIPDSADDSAREGFYRSFNTHFNTMIMSHEMFPGHYMQYKVAVRHAPAVRTLFSDGAYVEGWGSFSEELMLDAGWADNAPLTRLAHLRKRLENATRAYVSVMVNSAGWGQEEVRDFAVTEGLLAPQFAINLWHRVVNTPLQITTYFRGYRRFVELWKARESLQPALGEREWVDAVLRAGPVAMADLPGILKRAAAAE
jgi:uncharacterized protein (DUF885 family)